MEKGMEQIVEKLDNINRYFENNSGCKYKTMVHRIYVDNSASTQVSKLALEAMTPCFTENYGNPSAIHSFGQEAKKVLEQSRVITANSIGAKSTEIFFTSGGTESVNWAIHSACQQKSGKGTHIVSTEIEHNAVLKTLEKLQNQGFEVTLLKPDKHGQISPEQLDSAIRKDTVLVSIMMANNVIGAVLRIKELCAVAHKSRVLFHTDAVQAVGHIPVNVRDLGIDLLSLSAHKFHGPKGIGVLFSKIPRIPSAYITGGGQERGVRSGTENVPNIAGMAAALQESVNNLSADMAYKVKLRDRLIEQTLQIPGTYLTGDPQNRLPGHASFVFDGIGHSVYLINMLNDAGICASSGSACSAASKESSHVLNAVGIEEGMAISSLRISLSVYNTEKEIDIINAKLPEFIGLLRQSSPMRIFS